MLFRLLAAVYIHVPNSGITATDLKLVFNLRSTGTVAPTWKIKVSLLPCGANYLGKRNVRVLLSWLSMQFYLFSSGQLPAVFHFGGRDGAVVQLERRDWEHAAVSGSELSSLLQDGAHQRRRKSDQAFSRLIE